MNGQDIKELEEELSILEAKLQLRYSRLGKTVLETAESEQKAIDAQVNEIIKKKQQLSKALNEKLCPDCMVYNSSDSKFCKNCGQRLPDTQ